MIMHYFVKVNVFVGLLSLLVSDLAVGAVASNLLPEGVRTSVHLFRTDRDRALRFVCRNPLVISISSCDLQEKNMLFAEVREKLAGHWHQDYTAIDTEILNIEIRIEELGDRQDWLWDDEAHRTELARLLADYERILGDKHRTLREVNDQITLVRERLAQQDDPSLRAQYEALLRQKTQLTDGIEEKVQQREAVRDRYVRRHSDDLSDPETYRILEQQQRYWQRELQTRQGRRAYMLRHHQAALRIVQNLESPFIHDFRNALPNRPEDKRVVRSLEGIFME